MLFTCVCIHKISIPFIYTQSRQDLQEFPYGRPHKHISRFPRPHEMHSRDAIADPGAV